MKEIRLSLEQQANSFDNMSAKFSDVKLALVEIVTTLKNERSDRVLSADQAKAKLGVQDDRKWRQIKQDPLFKATINLVDGSRNGYSDKLIDEYILSKKIN